MIPQDVIMDMATIGLSPEQARVVASMLSRVEVATSAQVEAVAEVSRSKARARVQKWRDTHKSNVTERNATLQGVTERLTGERVPVEDITSNLEIEVSKQESKKVARPARLPSDFQLPVEWREWAIHRGLPEARVPIEFEKLTNWAANAPASKAVKPDWFRAWKNWVIGAIDALPRAGPAVRIDPTRAAAQTLMDQLNAVSPSEIEGHHPPPRLVAIGGRGG